jgi:hypothetical protein
MKESDGGVGFLKRRNNCRSLVFAQDHEDGTLSSNEERKKFPLFRQRVSSEIK